MSHTREEFLSAVLPELEEGQYYCSNFIGKTEIDDIQRVVQRFHRSFEELVQQTYNPPKGYWNTFFCVAAGTGESRKAHAMRKHRAFFLDVDLKEYKDKGKAWEALQTFYTRFDLPQPTVVDSGNGIHVYWSMSEDLVTTEWVKVATHLKNLCIEHKFYADPACTSDAARILRVPGTLNVKDPHNPKIAVCASISDPIDFQLFKDLIGYVEHGSFDAIEHQFLHRDNLNQTIINANSQHKSFKHGLAISLQGKGCAYIKIAYQYQELMTEPQWRSALSIAQFCSDKDAAIHHLSKRYEGYSRSATQAKAEGIEAPHTCETFRSAFSFMHGSIPTASSDKSSCYCDFCPHRADLNSPISLCVTQPEATAEANVIEAVEESTGAVVTVVIPAEEYPFPYARGAEGGVFKRATLDLESDDVPSLQDLQGKVVYAYDLWVDSLQVDPILGEIVVMCLKQPRQDLIRFAIPFSAVTSLRDFTKVISVHGISAPSYSEIMTYVKLYVTKLQKIRDKVQCPAHFGWDTDTWGSFVLGSRRYLASGEVEYCLPSASTAHAAAIYGVKNLKTIDTGASEKDKLAQMLSTWQNIFKIHARPGQEARLFATFVSMGSPLFAFFNNVEGIILHLVNKESGVGKSAIQHVCNSVWGRADKDTLFQLNDTKHSIMHHLGVLRHVVMCIDELTTADPASMCQFCFDVSSGRGRHRMESNVNKMRDNTTNWRTPVITSGNQGLHQLMTQHKMVADGEVMRVFELPIHADRELQTSKNKALTDKLFSEDLQACYGIVGDILLKHYVPHARECRDILMAARIRLDDKIDFTQRERYYSALCATAIAGAEISKKLGIHDIDLVAFEEWVVKLCRHGVAVADTARIPLIDQIKEFLHDMTPYTLVTTVAGTHTSTIQSPVSNLVHVRHMRNNNSLYLGYSQLKLWCTQRGVPINNVLEVLQKEANGRVATTRLDITSGVGVKCVRVDLDKMCCIED